MPGPTSVNLFMGQGVVADLSTCTLSSGEFGSCAPVVFFNNTNNQGALYHFPGLTDPADIRSRPNDKQAIKHLCEQVQPTHVYILTGGGTIDLANLGGPMKMTLGHIEAVEDIVREVSGRGVNISHTVPLNQVGNGVARGLSEHRALTADEQRVDYRVPQSVTSVSSLSISVANGVLRFANGVDDVDLSLTHRKDVARLLASTGSASCFAGNPNGNTDGDWAAVSHHPERLQLSAEQIKAQEATALALQSAYEKNLTPEERASLKHVSSSSSSGSDTDPDLDEDEPQLFIQPDLDASDDDRSDVRVGRNMGDGDSDPDEPPSIQNDVDSDDDRSIRGDDNAPELLPPLPDSDDDDDRSISAGDDADHALPPLPDDDDLAVAVQQNVVASPPIQNVNGAPAAQAAQAAAAPPRQNVAAALGRVPPVLKGSKDDIGVGTQKSVREHLMRSASVGSFPKAGKVSL